MADETSTPQSAIRSTTAAARPYTPRPAYAGPGGGHVPRVRRAVLVAPAVPAADPADGSFSAARRSASSAPRRSTPSATAMCACCRASSPSAARSFRAA